MQLDTRQISLDTRHMQLDTRQRALDTRHLKLDTRQIFLIQGATRQISRHSLDKYL